MHGRRRNRARQYARRPHELATRPPPNPPVIPPLEPPKGAAAFDAAIQRAFEGTGIVVRTSFTPADE
jgi:hypothetical protein